jgi:hypothetical protein
MGFRIGVAASSVYRPKGDGVPTKVDADADLGRLLPAGSRA